MTIRLLVVAEDSLARAGLATLLNDQPGLTVTGQLASGAELSGAAELYQPDVIVWDLGLDASRVFDRTTIRDIAAPVLALLADTHDASEAWSAGIRGLLPRDAPASNIAAASNAIAEGLTVIDPVFVSELFPTRDRIPSPPIEELTPREIQVLRLIAEGQSNKTIARELGISEHTVKFHVNAILSKLSVQSRTEAVVHATRLGLILL